MLNALRLHEGSRGRLEARTGLARATIDAQLAEATARGWLVEDAGHVRPTALGRRLGNDVVALFLT